MCPIAKAIVSTVRPNASDTPARPMPTSGKAAARTALPQPPSTNQNVPMNSAASFFDIGIHPPCGRKDARRPVLVSSFEDQMYTFLLNVANRYLIRARQGVDFRNLLRAPTGVH